MTERKGRVLTFDRSFRWLALFSLLSLTLSFSPAWSERFPPEPASYRLPEKPVEAASSDFTQDRNRILWQNVLTQELAHRFGSFLAGAAG